MKKIELIKVENNLYPLDIPFDEAYQLVNENNVPVGVVFLSTMPFADEIYVEWVELLTVFQGKGYLRYIFSALKEVYEGGLQFQCGEHLLKKYLAIGCTNHGISDITENYMMSY